MLKKSLCLAIVTLGVLGRLAWAQVEDEIASPVSNTIDEIVIEKLGELGIEPARGCSDSVFVRRLYLDVIGTLPTPEEVKAFLEDDRADKRKLLIDELLEREEFADYWSMKWCDVLRVKSEFPINLWPNGAQAYHRWVRTSIRENKPYDQFARELLTSSGSNFRVPQVNFYRAIQGTEPRTVAAAVALTFMGSRIEHWPEDRGRIGPFLRMCPAKTYRRMEGRSHLCRSSE